MTSNSPQGVFLPSEDSKVLLFVLDYLLDSERKSYEEYIWQEFENDFLTSNLSEDELYENYYKRPEVNHIFAFAKRIKDVVEASNLPVDK